MELEDLKEGGPEVEIVGFPADGPKKEVLHKHSGKICTALHGKTGGCTVTYKVDTSGGQSGCPIWLIDKSTV